MSLFFSLRVQIRERRVRHVPALDQTLAALAAVSPRRGFEERILTQLAADEGSVLQRTSQARRLRAGAWALTAAGAACLCFALLHAPTRLQTARAASFHTPAAAPGFSPGKLIVSVVPALPAAGGATATSSPIEALTLATAEARRAPAAPVAVGARRGRGARDRVHRTASSQR